MWQHGKYRLATPTHNFQLAPKVDMSATKLCAYVKNDGFARPIFPLQTFTKKISGHYILWSAIFSHILRYLDISQIKTTYLKAVFITKE